ncbi:hypothetical protein DPMN_074385 [Dreissena polymorpha]|uniref:Uncharacterized protein n=1 Tax=Dreissena polymorpha TaxID=45954 RepID=A0A9D3YHM0_DREPO|nr:hypothetical protein DPMN_074385 [Dreissena polymorpha]
MHTFIFKKRNRFNPRIHQLYREKTDASRIRVRTVPHVTINLRIKPTASSAFVIPLTGGRTAKTKRKGVQR